MHRRTLRERSKRSWNLKKQMGESKEIRRLIRQALEMDEGLVTNGFMVSVIQISLFYIHVHVD